jgi:hypothetical protein
MKWFFDEAIFLHEISDNEKRGSDFYFLLLIFGTLEI